jgi:phosphatidylserine synthase
VVMISTILYQKLPEFSLQSSSKNRTEILIVILGIITIILYPQETFFPLVFLYILTGPTKVIWGVLRPRNSNGKTESAESK